MEKFKKEEQAKSDKLDELSHLKDKVTKTSLNQNVILRYQQAMSKLQVDTKLIELINLISYFCTYNL